MTSPDVVLDHVGPTGRPVYDRTGFFSPADADLAALKVQAGDAHRGAPGPHSTEIMGMRKTLRLGEAARLLAMGMHTKDAAKALGISNVTLAKWLRDEPELMVKIRELNASVWEEIDVQLREKKKDAVERLREIADLALDELEELILNAKQEGVKLKAIDSALDRVPATARHGNNQGGGGTPVIVTQNLMVAAQAAREMDGYKPGGSRVGDPANCGVGECSRPVEAVTSPV